MKKLLVLLFVPILFIIACKKDDVFPSVEGTTWEMHMKWSSQPDTAIFYVKFNAVGAGEEVTSGGTPTGTTFTWAQDNENVSWTYTSPAVNVTGTTSSEGDRMSGTATFGSITGGWRAVPH